MTRRGSKPFVDFIPDWIDDIDLDLPENYRYRFAVDNFHRIQELREQFGAAKAYAEWTVRDRMGIEAKRRFACCRRDGQLGWQPNVKDVFDRCSERRTDKYYEHNGQAVYGFRFEVGINVLDPYSPKSPQWLERQAQKRREKKRKAEIVAIPLFAEQVSAEQQNEVTEAQPQ